ncbi:ParB/RepB/Spo0J family partition protein [Mesorhizobium australicum]|uniref:ParB/RepB/Spo0J family partition protein n=1 Tax=Mesorhizobium australicum TaxID=536018 RepID=UPI003338F35B
MATAKKKPTITLSPSRDIPFNQLVLSQSNVRRIKAGVSVEELAEDIARRGILQGLTVRPVVDENGTKTGMFEVPAGGRRFRALELLVKQKRLARTAPVPCVVREGGIAEEDSLAENVQRAPLHPLDQFRAFLTLREKGQAEEEIAATFFVSANVVKQRLKLASVSPALLDIYAEDGMTLAQLEAFTVSGDHARQEQVFERLKASYDKSAYAVRRMLTEGAVRASDKRAQFIGIDAYIDAGGTVLRDLFEGDDGGWLRDVAVVDQMLAAKLKVESETITAEGWKWTEVAPDFAYGHTYALRRLHGEPMPLTAKEEATRDALKTEFDRLVTEHEGNDELPDEVDARLGELETALEAFEARPLSFDPKEIARAGAFISIAGDGRLRVERGYVRPEDEVPVASEAEASDGEAMSDGTSASDNADDADGARGDITAEPEDDEGLSPISDRLMTELTAHRTLGLRHALGEQPDVAFRAALHAMTLRTFYSYGSDSCLELDLKTVSFGAQAPGLNDSVSAEAIRARHESWTKALPKDSAELWDSLGDWDSDSRAALFAHVVSLSVNSVSEAWNRRPRALAHADQLALAVDLDMAARWKPTADTFLGRVTKARILQAVAEAKGQRAADRIAHLKKGDMATEATTLLNGTGWLPEPLRTPGRETVTDMSALELAVVETAEVADETAMADDDGIGDDDKVGVEAIMAAE